MSSKGVDSWVNADPEKLKKLAKCLSNKYTHRSNTREKPIGIQLPPNPDSLEKNYITKKLPFIGSIEIGNAIRFGSPCYAFGHSEFSKVLILDVDNPDIIDIVESRLRGLKWKYKKFFTGGGFHYYIFFTSLPKRLIHKYGGGPAAIRAVGEAFQALFWLDFKEKIEIFGCGEERIKFPAMYDPYYRIRVLPANSTGKVISDFDKVVDFVCDIERNPSRELEKWINSVWRNPQLKEILRSHNSRNGSESTKEIVRGESINDYLDRLFVRPGQSHEIVPEIVFRCFLAEIPQDQVLGIIEEFFHRGWNNGQVRCKDSIRQWRSKAKSHIKRIYGKYKKNPTLAIIPVYHSYIEWVYAHGKTKIERVFLVVHFWLHLSNTSSTYFMSRPVALRCGEKWGLTEYRFKTLLDRLRNGEFPIEMIREGEKGLPRKNKMLRAAEYRIPDPPKSEGAILGEMDLDGFLKLVVSECPPLPPDPPKREDGEGDC